MQAAGSCTYGCSEAGCVCQPPIEQSHERIDQHINDKFDAHNEWSINWYETQFYPAVRRMAAQLNAAMVQQAYIVGTFFDAKHQLETQRLFQQLTSQAHKNYTPSEGMCEIGTSVRSLAASERHSDLARVAFANRMMDRQLLSGQTMSGWNADQRSRLEKYLTTYCHTADNSGQMIEICGEALDAENPDAGGIDPARRNKDIDYTRSLGTKLTIDASFLDPNGPTLADGSNSEIFGATSPDAEDIFALTANLFAHEVLPQTLPRAVISSPEGNPKAGIHRYLDLRSVAAKRSVAINSFSTIAGDRVSGTGESAPFIKRIVEELGVLPDDINLLLGENPSYFAQMEVLTKSIYQNPEFYTELYDKPANVLRKGAAIRAIGLMQDRDMYDSLLRSEAVLSVLLETMLHTEQARVHSALKSLKEGTEPIER